MNERERTIDIFKKFKEQLPTSRIMKAAARSRRNGCPIRDKSPAPILFSAA